MNISIQRHLKRIFIQLASILLTLELLGCTSGSTSVKDSEQKPDPVIVDFPIAYVIRSILQDEDGDAITIDIREPYQFNPGAILYLRDRASPTAADTDISSNAFPPLIDEDTGESITQRYDVKDIEASYDGTKIIFAMRAPEIDNVDDDEQPTWNIWEYILSTDLLNRVIASDGSTTPLGSRPTRFR